MSAKDVYGENDIGFNRKCLKCLHIVLGNIKQERKYYSLQNNIKFDNKNKIKLIFKLHFA